MKGIGTLAQFFIIFVKKKVFFFDFVDSYAVIDR